MDQIILSRKKLRMSQHKLAQKSGVPRWRIALLELKYDAPKKDEVKRMKQAIAKYRKECE